jgi:hypothetical protein
MFWGFSFTALIAEVILYSEGFESSKNLAQKMVQMYKLCSEQLSQLDHYDFGMRAVKSLLVMAGALKRQNPDKSEDVVLIRALRDSNLPKFLKQDAVLFQVRKALISRIINTSMQQHLLFLFLLHFFFLILFFLLFTFFFFFILLLFCLFICLLLFFLIFFFSLLLPRLPPPPHYKPCFYLCLSDYFYRIYSRLNTTEILRKTPILSS